MAVFFALFTGLTAEPGWPVYWTVSLLVAVVFLVIMIRFGLLSLVVMVFVAPLFFSSPTTFDLSRWYAGASLIGPLIAVALAAYGFWISLAGRPIFKDSLLDAAPAVRHS